MVIQCPPACLHVCMPACLPACMHACMHTWGFDHKITNYNFRLIYWSSTINKCEFHPSSKIFVKRNQSFVPEVIVGASVVKSPSYIIVKRVVATHWFWNFGFLVCFVYFLYDLCYPLILESWLCWFYPRFLATLKKAGAEPDESSPQIMRRLLSGSRIVKGSSLGVE